MRDLIAAIRDYVHHPDWRTSTANGISLLVASSQPFYPLYVWWLIGREAALVSLITWFSTPFFLLVPHFSRSNTFLCAWAFGVQTAVELFLIPVAILSILPFRRKEYAIPLALLFAITAAFFFLHDRYGAPLVSLDKAQTNSFVNLHIYSVVALSIYLFWAFAGIWFDRAEAARKRDHGEQLP